jgi:hypothetical protein
MPSPFRTLSPYPLGHLGAWHPLQQWYSYMFIQSKKTKEIKETQNKHINYGT